jgi:SAM-dependent methyltransferase
MTNWLLRRLEGTGVRRVLDVGCGGGGAIRKLSVMIPDVEIHGIDYSADSIRVASETNRELVVQGRVRLEQGAVSRLPYHDGFFDAAYAIESHYFWPHLVSDLQELHRVLSSGGQLVLGGGAYLGGRNDARNRCLARSGSMSLHSLQELSGLLRDAGYENVEAQEHWRRGWFCVTGRKSRQQEAASTPVS